MRFLPLLLISSLALGDVTVNGTVSLRNSLDAGIAQPVELRDRAGSIAEFTSDGRIDTGRDVPLWNDRFVGTALATHSKWAASILTQTVTVGAGAATLNASAITTINTYSDLLSLAKFRGYSDGPLYVHARVRPVNLPQTNALAEVGLGNALTTVAPTDGAFVRWTASGAFECVLNRGGAETSTAFATAPVADVYSEISLTVTSGVLKCKYTTPTSGATETVYVTNASGAPSAFGEAPGAMVRVVNGAVAPALAPQLMVGLIEVSQKVMDTVRGPDLLAATAGQGIAFVPTTGAQSANYTNSVAPVSATLSNTAAGYATLGGKFQFAAPVGAITDFALFSYAVPVSYRLVVTNIAISTCVTGAASATTPTMLEWGASVQATAASLATADAIAAAPTSAPRRVALGEQSIPVATAIGACVTEVERDFSKAPLVTDSGRFFTIIVGVPVGTATASELIRGTVTIAGYFEQQ